MTPKRQLNIRDDEIYDLAQAAAQRMGGTVKDAVRAALLAYHPKAETPAGARERARRLAELDAITARMAKSARPDDGGEGRAADSAGPTR